MCNTFTSRSLHTCPYCLFFFLMIRRPPRSTLFPLHDALPIFVIVVRLIFQPTLGVDASAADVDLELPAWLGLLSAAAIRSEEHTSELQSRQYLVCRLLLEKKTTSEIRKASDGSVENQMLQQAP